MPLPPPADLPPDFLALPATTQVALIRLVTDFYHGLQADLRSEWDAAMTADESTKAKAHHEEGRRVGSAEMLEKVRDRLGAADALAIRLAAAEEANRQLQAAKEYDIIRCVTERLDGFRKDYELAKMAETVELREKVATATAHASMMEHLQTTVSLLSEKLEAREAQLAELTAASTKSSHAIGKAGEATVWELIETVVLAEFPYAEAKNMAGVSHAADFHVWVMMPTGKRMKVLIDSKKYKRSVNSDEIAKLVTDVDNDDDAHAGIMVSLNSSICSTKQFQIRSTEKGKPILYLSFQDTEAHYHGQLLCWAIRALVAAVRDTKGEVTVEVERIEKALNDIQDSVKEMDDIIKAQLKSVESMRSIKMGILQKIMDFRVGANMGAPDEGCVALVKATGLRCGRKVADGDRCSNHKPRKNEQVGNKVIE